MATGFLISSLAGALKRIGDAVDQQVLKILYVKPYVKRLDSNIRNSKSFAKQISELYSSTSELYPNLDLRIILNEFKEPGKNELKKTVYDVDVVILPKSYKSDDVKSLIKNEKNVSVLLLEDGEDVEEDKVLDSPMTIYNNVVLGGTFDRLHAGHKILISQALLQCSNSVTVGVTDGNMIKSKILWELIEPCEKRMEIVRSFIEDVDNTVSCNVVSIDDIYGPTKTDPDLNMIVVSSETEKGGVKVNELRRQTGMSELVIHSINLVEDGLRAEEEESKISSSNYRKRLLGTRLREPEDNPELPKRPYIIGLTGGICSGKSSIGEYLKTLGAHLIDCDKIAHQLYSPGTKVYYQVVDTFGEEILTAHGEIDRKKLGGIVFKDQDKLEMLNGLLWPGILKESLDQCRKVYEEQQKEIIVLEAAVLLRAGWYKNVHEVWTAIIPPDEAIRRLKNRNGLSDEEATLRLHSQPSNVDQVAIANVVFCTLWSYDFTHKQVKKAWNILNYALNPDEDSS